MFLTQREAAAFIGDRTGMPRRAATRLLDAGLAGTPQRTSASLLYERDQVVALTEREAVVEPEAWPQGCSGGVLLARTTDPVDPLASVTGPGRHSLVARAFTRILRPDGQGWYPLVVVMNHHVVGGAELLDVVPVPADHPEALRAQSWPGKPRLWTLRTRAPGPWFAETFEGRTLRTGAGNRYLFHGLPGPLVSGPG